MPRAKRIFTHEFPYHVTARTNNREWFGVGIARCWEICLDQFRILTRKYHWAIHAFVLMDNHYHLLCSTDERAPLNIVMHAFQTAISRSINGESGRINHTFGARYSAAVIQSRLYYAHALRYVYQNPIRAGIVGDILEYKFSTARAHWGWSQYHLPFPLSAPASGADEALREFLPRELMAWMNEPYDDDTIRCIKRAVRHSKFEAGIARALGRPHWIQQSLFRK